MNHSPGPWQHRYEGSSGWGIYDANGVEVGSAYNGPNPAAHSTHLDESNARLIAAAPELLEALKDRLASQPNCVCDPAFWVVEPGWKCPACRDRALIARIEGGE